MTKNAIADRPVEQVMSRPVVAVRDNETLDRSLQVLAIADLHHVAVVDRDGRFYGLLSDRTVASAWLNHAQEFSRLRAGDVVDIPRQPVVEAGATVREAALMMQSCGTDAVAVLDDLLRPVGVVTVADFVALIAKADPGGAGAEDGRKQAGHGAAGLDLGLD